MIYTVELGEPQYYWGGAWYYHRGSSVKSVDVDFKATLLKNGAPVAGQTNNVTFRFFDYRYKSTGSFAVTEPGDYTVVIDRVYVEGLWWDDRASQIDSASMRVSTILNPDVIP